MRRKLWLAGLCWLVVAVGARASAAEGTALVIADRVNVRGQPSLAGDLITQLRKGPSVTVLEEIQAPVARAGEPGAWCRIRMPADTPLWVHAAYVDPQLKTVTAHRLNVRAGPSEHYSVLGQILRGALVKPIRVMDDWMEIEAPPGSYGFVATEFLQSEHADGGPTDAPPRTETEAPVRPAAPLPPATTLPTPPARAAAVSPPPSPESPAAAVAIDREPEPAPPSIAPAHPPPGLAFEAATGSVAPPAPAIAPVASAPVARSGTPLAGATRQTRLQGVEVGAPAGVLPSPDRRIVRREGIVRGPVSRGAPTYFILSHPQTGAAINYLHPASPDQRIKPLKGRRVVVVGEEWMDPRWPKTPLLELHLIELAP